ncbi:unannotated protein [freshwater metagenome]|uniref:Unannotated protein n=1 Tax=freshwater metagenome TaxID=449393 RepID=A0A6J7L0A7_9ZZZZ
MHCVPISTNFWTRRCDTHPGGTARAFGSVAANLRVSGRKPAARAYDALIAATALAHGLPIYTTNPVDFEGIDGLVVVDLGVR